jgi:hypothetical protein
LTELRDIKLSLRFFSHYFDVLAILSSITSNEMTFVTLFVWEFPSPDDLDNFSLKWLKIENALCRLWELKKGTESVGEVALNVYLDNEKLTDEISELLKRGKFMPRLQEGGVMSVRIRTIDLSRSPFTVVSGEIAWGWG